MEKKPCNHKSLIFWTIIFTTNVNAVLFALYVYYFWLTPIGGK